MRHILYISGSRADYGPIRRTLQAIQTEPDFCLSILPTGMHLDPAHGETWQEIARDGFTIAAPVNGYLHGNSLSNMASSVGLYLFSMSQVMEAIKPDIVMVLGDRGEQLAGAMAAAFQNIVVVHLCGGSLSGSIDDSIRHAITKFAHYHLPASEEHARRIRQMGECSSRIKIVGLPGGNIKPDVVYPRSAICQELDLPEDVPYLLVNQHAVTHSQDKAAEQIIETLEALVSLPYPALLANPNNDSGGHLILAKMHEYAANCPHLHILPPVCSRELFASIMTHAGAMIGNSSSGIAEAMSINLPVINVGNRQHGREHLACLINTDYDRQQIIQAVNTALFDPVYRKRLAEFKSPLIRSETEKVIVNFLHEIDVTAGSRPKEFLDRGTVLPSTERRLR